MKKLKAIDTALPVLFSFKLSKEPCRADFYEDGYLNKIFTDFSSSYAPLRYARPFGFFCPNPSPDYIDGIDFIFYDHKGEYLASAFFSRVGNKGESGIKRNPVFALRSVTYAPKRIKNKDRAEMCRTLIYTFCQYLKKCNEINLIRWREVKTPLLLEY